MKQESLLTALFMPKLCFSITIEKKSFGSLPRENLLTPLFMPKLFDFR